MAMLTIWAITMLAEFLASDKTRFVAKRNEIFERGTHKSFHALFLNKQPALLEKEEGT